MADVIYKKGQSANLDNVAIAEGQILVTEDTAEMYVDMSNGTRKKISDNDKQDKFAEYDLVYDTWVPADTFQLGSNEKSYLLLTNGLASINGNAKAQLGITGGVIELSEQTQTLNNKPILTLIMSGACPNRCITGVTSVEEAYDVANKDYVDNEIVKSKYEILQTAIAGTDIQQTNGPMISGIYTVIDVSNNGGTSIRVKDPNGNSWTLTVQNTNLSFSQNDQLFITASYTGSIIGEIVTIKEIETQEKLQLIEEHAKDNTIELTGSIETIEQRIQSNCEYMGGSGQSTGTEYTVVKISANDTTATIYTTQAGLGFNFKYSGMLEMSIGDTFTLEKVDGTTGTLIMNDKINIHINHKTTQPTEVAIHGLNKIESDELTIAPANGTLKLKHPTGIGDKNYTIFLVGSASGDFTSGIVQQFVQEGDSSYYAGYINEGQEGFSFQYDGAQGELSTEPLNAEFTLSHPADSGGIYATLTLKNQPVEGARLAGVRAPLIDTDAVNKFYVDNNFQEKFGEVTKQLYGTELTLTGPNRLSILAGNEDTEYKYFDAIRIGHKNKPFNIGEEGISRNNGFRLNIEDDSVYLKDPTTAAIGIYGTLPRGYGSLNLGVDNYLVFENDSNSLYVNAIGSTYIMGGGNDYGCSLELKDRLARISSYKDISLSTNNGTIDLSGNKVDIMADLIELRSNNNVTNKIYTIQDTGSASDTNIRSGVITSIHKGSNTGDDIGYTLNIENGSFCFTCDVNEEELLNIPAGSTFTLTSPAGKGGTNTLYITIYNPVSITNVATPINNNDAANKAYVDALDNVLKDIRDAIRGGGTTEQTVAQIEQLITNYLETKTIAEVEE